MPLGDKGQALLRVLVCKLSVWEYIIYYYDLLRNC